MMPHLDWETERHATEFVLCKWGLPNGQEWTEHSHDFYELFWIETGFLEHTLNGVKSILGPGTIVFLSPGDSHCARSIDCDKVFYVNMCIQRETVESLFKRYAIDGADSPWAKSESSHKIILTPTQILNLNELFLNSDCNSQMDCDLLLTQIIKYINKANAYNICALPDKLQHALYTIEKQKRYSEGVLGLVDISGFSREYISRAIRKATNRSAIELINDIRMAECRRDLLYTDMPIIDIAFKLGFQSMPYFFKIFKKYYNMTPLKFRKNKRFDTFKPEKKYGMPHQRLNG